MGMLVRFRTEARRSGDIIRNRAKPTQGSSWDTHNREFVK